jgi:L-alanine-DL-glutamate epimerase-like enolase superfamily enzyme
MQRKIKRAEIDHLLYRLPGAVGGSGVSAVDVYVVELECSDGSSGWGFSYGLRGGAPAVRAAAADMLDRFVLGHAADAPAATWRQMNAALNRIGRGAYYVAMAAVDLALWDLHAKQRKITLAEALGGRPRAVPVYGSGGYTATQSPDSAAEMAATQAKAGFPLVKLRLAGDRNDIARIKAVRAALPDGVDIAADANEKCDLARAQWLAKICADHDLLWLEEPLPAQDLAGYAALARNAPVSIALGEHLQGVGECMPFLEAHACAVVQPDLAAIGGISESLRLCHVAEAFGIGAAPHFLPALFVHVAAAAPNVTWLEDFPLLEPLFDISVKIDNQRRMAPGDRPGHGLKLRDDARKEYRVTRA